MGYDVERVGIGEFKGRGGVFNGVGDGSNARFAGGDIRNIGVFVGLSGKRHGVSAILVFHHILFRLQLFCDAGANGQSRLGQRKSRFLVFCQLSGAEKGFFFFGGLFKLQSHGRNKIMGVLADQRFGTIADIWSAACRIHHRLEEIRIRQDSLHALIVIGVNPLAGNEVFDFSFFRLHG